MNRPRRRKIQSSRPVALRTGHLEHCGECLQDRMPEERAERPAADHSLAEVLVAVPVRAKRHLRVVQMQATEPLEPDLIVE